MAGVYVYGFVDAPSDDAPAFRASGVAGAPVSVLYEGAIGALVSRAPGLPVAIAPDRLMVHEDVLERALAHHTVLPVAFGTVAATRAEVRALIARHQSVIAAELERLRGRVECAVKVYWRPQALLRELGALAREVEEPERRGLDADVRRALAIEVGQRTESVVERWRSRYARSVLGPLEAAAQDSHLGEPIGPRMLYNAAFLVARGEDGAFRARVRQLADRFEQRLTLKFSGPLPPHNFVALRLN